MYYATFVYLLVLVFIGKNYSRKARFALAAFPLVLVAFLRYGVGADYFSYQYIYEYLDTSSFFGMLNSQTNIELVFRLLVFISSNIRIPFHIFIGMLSTVMILLNLKWIQNNSPKFEQSVLLQYSMLYFYWNLSAMRQGLVVVVLLYVYFNGRREFTIKEKVFWTVLTSFMHVSAIIVPAIYLLSKLKWNKKLFILLLVLAPLSRIVFDPSVMSLIARIPYIGKVASYVSYDSIKYLSMPSIMRLSFILIILVHYDKLAVKYSGYRDFYNFSLLGLIGYFYLPLAMVIGTRVTIFSYSLLVIILPMIVELYDNVQLKKMGMISILSISSLSFYNEYSKLVARTGYTKSKHKLNFVTVLNGNPNDFDNAYTFYIQLLDDDKEWKKNSELNQLVSKNYLTTDTLYTPSDNYIGVKFGSNNKYGVINQNGEVVAQPLLDNRPIIYKNYILSSSEWAQGIENFYFRKIPKSYKEKDSWIHSAITYSDIENSIDNEIIEKNTHKFSKMLHDSFEIEKLREIDFLKDYNLEPIKAVVKFSYDNNTDFSYLRLMTTNRDYFIIMKNNQPLVQKIFTEIEPIDDSGFIVGYTKNLKIYINKDGKYIWFENI